MGSLPANLLHPISTGGIQPRISSIVSVGSQVEILPWSVRTTGSGSPHALPGSTPWRRGYKRLERGVDRNIALQAAWNAASTETSPSKVPGTGRLRKCHARGRLGRDVYRNVTSKSALPATCLDWRRSGRCRARRRCSRCDLRAHDRDVRGYVAGWNALVERSSSFWRQAVSLAILRFLQLGLQNGGPFYVLYLQSLLQVRVLPI